MILEFRLRGDHRRSKIITNFELLLFSAYSEHPDLRTRNIMRKLLIQKDTAGRKTNWRSLAI